MPPLVGVAVNVTEVPAQIELDVALMATLAGNGELTETLAVLFVDMALLHVVPELRLVTVTVVTPPTANAVVVKVPDPEAPPVNVIDAIFPVALVVPDRL